MKKYKHKKTGDVVEFAPKLNKYFGHEIKISPQIVENSNDWELVKEEKYIVVRYKDSAGNEYYRKGNGKFTINLQYEYEEDKLINRDLLIQTIRRVSDNVNFSVGDKVVWDWKDSALPYFTINKFFYNENELSFGTKQGSDFKLSKMLLSHYKPLPKYRSDDGYNIYEDDEFHIVHKDKFSVIEGCKYPVSDSNLWLIFKRKDKLDEYIWLNKPCLSINDVGKVYVTANRKNPRRDSGWEKQTEQLINIVMKKINK